MTSGAHRRRWTTPVRLAGIGLVTVLAVTTIGLGASAWAWGDSLRVEQRLLPGTAVATVAVGGLTVDEAIGEVEGHLASQLDRAVTVTSGDASWETTARQLGAATDTGQVVSSAYERTRAANLRELARLRWAGGEAGIDLDVSITIPDVGVERFVDGIADEIHRDPIDATLTWTGERAEVDGSEPGRRIDRGAAVAAVSRALDGASETVDLEIEEVAPSITTGTARQVAEEVEALVERRLDHLVTVRLGDRRWEVTPRDLAASVTVEPVLEAALTAAGDADRLPALALVIEDDEVAAFVARIAAEVDRPARDASVDVSSGEMRVTPERDGRALDRSAVREDLRAALDGTSDEVAASTSVRRAAVTTASFDRLLYLDQSARRVALIERGDVVRSWPVAVGMGGSPTPTGTFTVGAKRYEPTWHNPAQDRWGADMPATMGPGPDNPLGARAVNWNRNGRDTLIRFHGTPDEASIGQAASRGCVRMRNADVIELYDLVATGTTIVSVR